MPSRLADRLAAARRQRFVGRSEEMALFASLLPADSPVALLHVYGPGGVGKTTLLRAFAWHCAEQGIPTATLDARDIEPAPDALRAALNHALAPLAPLAAAPQLAPEASDARQVVFLDTYETLAPLDDWLRDALLPSLPAQTLVVLAGRLPLAPTWRADPGWEPLVRAIALRNFRPEESRAYLSARDIPAEQHATILDFTHGHPLALSLIADAHAQRRGLRFQPEDAPDIVKALLEDFAQALPGPAHRRALEACALVRLTTEPLLAAMLAMPDAHELFEWLRSLSFIESGQAGILPHDLARETLDADLRWRDPDWYDELHRRARAYYTAHLGQAGDRDHQRILFDLIFLHRHNPVINPYLAWQESGVNLPEPATHGDAATLERMVARHEGDESARILNYWLARHPERFLVFRDASGQPAGFLAALPLHETTTAARAFDPAAVAAWRAIEARGALRPGEAATLFRFWMAADTYQAVSPVQTLILVNVVRHCLMTPRLAYTLVPCADPDFWGPAFAYADLARVPGADFMCGGRRYGAFGHDWRAVPPAAWLTQLGERELGQAAAQATPPPSAQTLVVLSQPEFAAAVRAALRDYARPDALRANPLLRSHMVQARTSAGASGDERVAALRALLGETADALRGAARDAKLYRALHHTYLQPAPTQERAAELLDLPFSTYRRHLKDGIARVVDLLWQREVGLFDTPTS